MNELRIVLLGKTGDGKSSCGNAILGEASFVTGNSPNSVTKLCESKTKSVHGRQVTVVDAPGYFDTTLPPEQINSEILRCIIFCAPGPHAFVIVLKVARYMKHEMETVDQMMNSFGEEALKHAVVLFTFGIQLAEGQIIENYVEQSEELQHLVGKCGGRCHVIDNKYWNQQGDQYRNNIVQMEKLLNTIEDMVRENNGQYYSNEILQQVHRVVEAQMESLRSESNGSLQNANTLRQTAQQRVHTKLSVRLVGVATGALLGALFGFGIALTAYVPFTASIQAVLGIAKKKSNSGTKSAQSKWAKAVDVVTENAPNVLANASDSVTKSTPTKLATVLDLVTENAPDVLANASDSVTENASEALTKASHSVSKKNRNISKQVVVAMEYLQVMMLLRLRRL